MLSVHSTPSHMYDGSDVVCGTYLQISTYEPVRYFAHMEYMCSVLAIFVSDTYMPIWCEVNVTDGCVFGIY